MWVTGNDLLIIIITSPPEISTILMVKQVHYVPFVLSNHSNPMIVPLQRAMSVGVAVGWQDSLVRCVEVVDVEEGCEVAGCDAVVVYTPLEAID